ncbi:hypothetical protein L596_027881 [Steinernema carpocapsae]|uniref:EGF-like domain-containing protein n=1 Tax=Steinernema carpocapsae TaxID=34508 RepID=A0A4U5LWU2_STECR|nr:hypothetical protein L596_027881 [Steinernema carpocapsae]
MGWLFSKVHHANEYNGFDLTGGVFNRTVTIHLGERYKVAIRQEFSGRHIQDYYAAKTTVTGTLPEVPEGSEVVFDDHEENYRREGSGYVRSYAAQSIRIVYSGGRHESFQMSVDQLIQYKECPFKTFNKAESVQMRFRQVNVHYEPENQLVRFGVSYTSGDEEPARQHQTRDPSHQTQEASEEEQVDPCTSGEHLCNQPNMRCQVESPSYRCICDRGFSAVADAAVQVGFSCVDLDECARGDHNCDRNAECRNLPGTFECACRDGFYGDGYFCESPEGSQTEGNTIEEVAPAGPEHSQHHQHHQHQQNEHQETMPAASADGCTSHQECHQWGECVFGQNGQPGHCKCRGWYVGDGVNHCGPPEENVQPQQPQQPQEHHHQHHQHQNHQNQQQQQGVQCDGTVCDVNADCNPAPDGGMECVCRAGFSGTGLECESLSGEQHSHQHQHHHQKQPEQSSDQCHTHDECGENAYCKLISELEAYQCACRDRHSRVGGVCVRDHEDECNNHEMCGENGFCHYNREEQFYQCKCREGTEKIGGICTRPADKVEVEEYEEVEEDTRMCNQFKICHKEADCVYEWNTTLSKGIFNCRCKTCRRL